MSPSKERRFVLIVVMIKRERRGENARNEKSVMTERGESIVELFID